MTDQQLCLFCDLETTGLDHLTGEIVEASFLLTNADLEPIDVPITYVVSPSKSPRNLMDDYVWGMHAKNGLLEELALGGVSIWWLDALLAGRLEDLAPGGDVWLAGSGVAQFDRQWVRHFMPLTDQFLSYKTLDIGHLRRLFQLVGHEFEDNQPVEHRAEPDMLYSLALTQEFVKLIGPILSHSESP